MPTKIASRKAKARRLQNYICQKFSDITGIPWGKDKDIEGREMGQSGPDVKLYGMAAEMLPFSVEAKAQERWSVPEWIRQAKENQKDGTNWILVCKRNRKKPVVVMDFDVFCDIYYDFLVEVGLTE